MPCSGLSKRFKKTKHYEMKATRPPSDDPDGGQNYVAEENKNATEIGGVFMLAGENQTARSTLLERRHLVQAYTWQGVPLTTALTRLTLGFHARLERLWE